MSFTLRLALVGEKNMIMRTDTSSTDIVVTGPIDSFHKWFLKNVPLRSHRRNLLKNHSMPIFEQLEQPLPPDLVD